MAAWLTALHVPECDIPGTDPQTVSALPPARVDPSVAQVQVFKDCAAGPALPQRRGQSHTLKGTKPNHRSSHWRMLRVPPRKEWLPGRSPAPIAPMPKPFSDHFPSPTPPPAEASGFQFTGSTAFLRPPGHCPSPDLPISVTEGHSHPLAAAPRAAPPRESASPGSAPAGSCCLEPD